MKFLVPDDFDLQVFLTGCDVDGVLLYKNDLHPTADGLAILKNNLLEVELYIPTTFQQTAVTLNAQAQGGILE